MGDDKGFNSLADLIAGVALFRAERGDHVTRPAVIPIRKVGVDGAGIADEGGIAIRGGHIGIRGRHILKAAHLHDVQHALHLLSGQSRDRLGKENTAGDPMPLLDLGVDISPLLIDK